MDWINSFNDPHCILVNSYEDLKDGKHFCALSHRCGPLSLSWVNSVLRGRLVKDTIASVQGYDRSEPHYPEFWLSPKRAQVKQCASLLGGLEDDYIGFTDIRGEYELILRSIEEYQRYAQYSAILIAGWWSYGKQRATFINPPYNLSSLRAFQIQHTAKSDGLRPINGTL